MRGSLKIGRIGGTVMAAAALAAAAAGPAQAMIGPACSARLTATETTTASSCTFDTQYDWATVTVAPTGTVTVTITCFTTYGYKYVTQRTVGKATSWATWTPGSCRLSLSGVPGTTALATVTPTTGPIIQPYPVP